MGTLWSTPPEELDLGPLAGALDTPWQQTLHDGLEHGACILLQADGTLGLAHEVTGMPDGVAPAHRVGDYADHVGFFHTHPLRSDGSGQWGFSNTDFAGMLEDGCTLSLVRSGPNVYALLRTASTLPPAPVTDAEEAEFAEVFVECRALFRGAEGEREANRRLCQQRNLALYAGPASGPLPRLYP